MFLLPGISVYGVHSFSSPVPLHISHNPPSTFSFPNFPYATQKSPPVATIVNTNERLAKVIVNASNVFPYIAIVTIS